MLASKIWIAVACGLLTGCAHNDSTRSQSPEQKEYEKVTAYCKDASRALGLPTTNQDRGHLPREFEQDVVGYDECIQRYWPESPARSSRRGSSVDLGAE